MSRVKLKDRMLPLYTRGEEIFNMVSHIVGGAVGVISLVLCVIVAAIKGNIYGIVSGAIFGTSMILLYCMSSIYHGLKKELMAKKVFQIIDHCTIFILIAGTYTPFTLCTIRGINVALGWTVFGIIWAAAALGVTLNAIDLKKYKTFSMICYLAMGWCVIMIAKPMAIALGRTGTVLLVAGGVAYTLGAVLYSVGIKKKYYHSVFHIFCVLGSLLHFLCILLYVI